MANDLGSVRRIAQLARSVSSTLDLETVLEHVTAAVTALRPDIACSVRLIDERTGGYRLAGVGGVPIPERTPVIPRGRGLTHAVVDTACPLLLEHYPDDPRSLQRLRAARRHLTVYYGTPIGIDGEVLGVLSVHLPAGQPPTTEEQTLIDTLAEYAATAIRNAGRFAQSEARRRAAETLADVSRGLVQDLDPALLGQRIVDGARDLLGGHRATLLRIEPDVGELTIVAISGADAECPQPPRFPETYEIAAWAVEARRLTIIPDFLADPRLAGFSRWRAEAERAIDRAFFAIPLLVQDQAIGAIVVTHRIGWSVEGEALGLIQAFADSAALALENARLYGEATRRRHEAEELARIARLLTETLDFPTVANRIAEVVLALLRVPASVVRIRQADGSLIGIASAGRTRDAWAPGHVLPPGIGTVGKAIAEGQPVIEDPLGPGVVSTEDFRRRQASSGIRKVLAVPLRDAKTVLGVLAVGDEAGRAFSAAEVALLQAFGDQAAIALTNARLFEETERRRRAAESLADLGRVLTRSLDAGDVSQRIVDSIRMLLGTSAAVLYRVDAATQNLGSIAFSGQVGLTLSDRVAVMPSGFGIVGRAVQQRQPVTTADVLADPQIALTPELRQWVEQGQIRALLAAPLIVQGRVIGALATGTRAGRVYDAEDIRLAQIFADQAAIAMENSRLYGELHATLRQVEQAQRHEA